MLQYDPGEEVAREEARDEEVDQQEDCDTFTANLAPVALAEGPQGARHLRDLGQGRPKQELRQPV